MECAVDAFKTDMRRFVEEASITNHRYQENHNAGAFSRSILEFAILESVSGSGRSALLYCSTSMYLWCSVMTSINTKIVWTIFSGQDVTVTLFEHT